MAEEVIDPISELLKSYNQLSECPWCCGRKGSNVHHNYGPNSKDNAWAWRDCTFCGGTGEVDNQMMERWHLSKVLRRARIKSGLTLLTASEKYGKPVSTISGIEIGRMHHSEAPGFINIIAENM